MRSAMSRKQFGRQYSIKWDDEVRRFHVTLGKTSVGFHLTEEGARKLAVAHARQVTVAAARTAFDVVVEPRNHIA